MEVIKTFPRSYVEPSYHEEGESEREFFIGRPLSLRSLPA